MHLCQLFCIGHLPAISQHQWTMDTLKTALEREQVSVTMPMFWAKPTRISTAQDTVCITGFDKPFHVCLQASGGLERTWCSIQLYGIQLCKSTSSQVRKKKHQHPIADTTSMHKAEPSPPPRCHSKRLGRTDDTTVTHTASISLFLPTIHVYPEQTR